MRNYLYVWGFLCVSLLLAACSGVPSANQRWDHQSPKSASGPRTLATPGGVVAQEGEDVSGGQGPFAEGGVAYEKASAHSDLPPVKVAILLPLSGQGAEVGQSLLQAAQLALFDLGADTFELLPKDTNGTAIGASQAAQDAIQEGAQLMIGPLFSHSVKAVKPLARRANINVIGFSTDWAQAGGNVYLMGFMPFTQVTQVTNYAASQGLRRIALITKTDVYGSAVERTFMNVAGSRGVQIPKIIRLGTAGLTMSDVQALRSAALDGVFIAVGGAEAANISRQLHQGGMSALAVKRLSTGLWDDENLAREPVLDGAWFSAPAPHQRRAFEESYEALYVTKPPRLATLAYDAMALAAVLGKMGQRGKNGIYIPAYDTESLRNSNGFSGIDGVFRFNGRGLIERQLSVLEFRNGGIVEVKSAGQRF